MECSHLEWVGPERRLRKPNPPLGHSCLFTPHPLQVSSHLLQALKERRSASAHSQGRVETRADREWGLDLFKAKTPVSCPQKTGLRVTGQAEVDETVGSFPVIRSSY
ncbi:hypothetical protein JOB18_040330 [Solea senegalensis]|uniref:Uncharacterized protein n=1 Tax=Solea senegalensis TaxID=28829 RepID=A0AAV6T1D5_SOLSE|nr:hypothetical protein JOB18_040330 [Solea senegalensis]